MTNLEIDRLIRQLANSDTRKQTIDALVQHGSDAVESLCQALGDEDQEVRRHATAALGKIGDARAVEPLCKALGDEDSMVRVFAAMSLEQIGDAVTLPRKVLAETRLTPQQRLRGLEALRHVRYVRYRDISRVLHYPLPHIRGFCQMMQQDDDNAVREGAQAVLAFLDASSILLRPSRPDETTEQEELLRGVAPSGSSVVPEEMLRPLEEGTVPALSPRKRRGLLARWLGRER